MAVLDAAGRILGVNLALAAILAGEPADFEGRHIAESTHPDDLALDRDLMEALAAGPLEHFETEKRMVRKDGNTVWVRTRFTEAAPGAQIAERRLVMHVEDLTELRLARDLISRRALFDPVTGLPNRTLLLERLGHSLEVHESRQSLVACVFLDVDHFKGVNDTLGHDAGDHLLVEIAKRIQASVRTTDTVARLGGDEFVVVLDDMESAEHVQAAVTAIASAVAQPMLVAEHNIVPSVSGGVALGEPGVGAEALMRHADLAMFAAKAAGRARVEFFDSSMSDIALARLSIESELRTAIRDGELAVYFQPVVELETKSVVGYEALVRWNHPQRGLLMPDEFIAISEDANLVVPLGAIVLGDACAFLASRPHFRGKVFVNVSTRQIGAADLTRVVREALARTGASPSQLGLEITESGMLMASAAARADLKALVDLGVDLLLDDFGTGYSALSSVLQNPVAGIKLAREFTLRLGDRGTGDRISTAVASLARSLEMYGIIEGIETEAQYAIARRHGWPLAQGFLFGHPLPASEIP